MSLTDRHGNPLATRSREAAAHFDRALELFHTYTVDPIAALDEAIAADPDFLTAHCLKAALLTTSSEQAAESALGPTLAQAEALSARMKLEREGMYIAAAQAWLRRDFAEGVKRFGDIAICHPRDLAALQVAHLLDFLLGHSTMLRDRPAQTLDAWQDDEPGYFFTLGMHAFGLEETGLYAAAESAGRRALEACPRDSWAAHAVAHVLEMQGRVEEGIAWIESTAPGWNEGSFFGYHNWWHLTLHRLERGEYREALALYDARIRNPSSRVAMEMVDASALLWRLRLRGADVGSRWEELANAWAEGGEAGYYAFNDVHALMAFLAAGRDREVRRIGQALESAAQKSDTNAMMSREVGAPLARALVSFERGRFDAAIDELLRVRPIASRFGGSHAQRDVLGLTLAEAAVRARRRSLVRALAAERLASKPHSPFNLQLASRARATTTLAA